MLQRKHIFLKPPNTCSRFDKENIILCNTFGSLRNFAYLCQSIKTSKKVTQEEKTNIEERIVDVLKTVYDPEIPVNVYDLGMIYKIDVQDDPSASQPAPADGPAAIVELDMTFTAPNCPAADFILEDVRTKVESVEGVKAANVNLVFEPAWDQSMMTEEARVELGFD